MQINAGTSNGIQVGHVLVVETPVCVVRDPETRQITGRDSHRIGTVKITTVESPEASTGFFISRTPGIGSKARRFRTHQLMTSPQRAPYVRNALMFGADKPLGVVGDGTPGQ